LDVHQRGQDVRIAQQLTKSRSGRGFEAAARNQL